MKKNAFTLIELMVATGLMGLLLLALTTMIANGFRTYRVGQKRVEVSEKVNKVTSDFEKVTRGATEIISADSSSFSYFSYLHEDKRPAPTKINYVLEEGRLIKESTPPFEDAGRILYRDEDKSSRKVAENVTNLDIFSYIDANGSDLAFPVQKDLIKAVRITVAVAVTVGKGTANASQSTVIGFRNLKTNL